MTPLLDRTARVLAIGAGLAMLSACGGTFSREAGAQLDSGDFGNATVHNQLAQTCRANGAGGGKYGTVAGDPVVVLDPQSTPSRKVYRVHCDGRLDGKYATVIYNEYVRSGTQQNTIERADSE